MGSFLETLYDVVFQPGKAMREIAGEKKLGQSFAAFFLSTALPLWALYCALQTSGLHNFAGAAIALHAAGSLIFWFVSAALLGLTAELFGGQGRVGGLFAAMGFIHIPRLFVIPLWAMTLFMSHGARTFWLAAGMLLIAVWTLYLAIAAIKGAYSVSGSKAVLVMLFPAAALILLGILTILFAGASVISAMPGRWW